MKLLAFTDIHGSLKALQHIEKMVRKHNPDVLVDCGDISIFENELDFLVKKIACLKKKCLIIHGNHERASRFEAACSRHKNMIFMHNKIHRIGNYVFFGWGGGGFSLKDDAFEEAAANCMQTLKKSDKLILMTHAVPNGVKIDKIYGKHSGNKSIRKFIEKHRPAIALCGHLHEFNGKSDEIKGIKVLNPGPMGKVIVV